jgi:hypothetical protein
VRSIRQYVGHQGPGDSYGVVMAVEWFHEVAASAEVD